MAALYCEHGRIVLAQVLPVQFGQPRGAGPRRRGRARRPRFSRGRL